MPIREYVCGQCGHQLERLQKLSDAPLTDCPDCGASALERKISAVGFRLSGGGWYETDFKSDARRNIAGETDSSNSDTGSEKTESSASSEADSGSKSEGHTASGTSESGQEKKSTSSDASKGQSDKSAGQSAASSGKPSDKSASKTKTSSSAGDKSG